MAYSDLYVVGANVDKPAGATQAPGTDDQDTINAAIASLPANGGQVTLAGEFLVSGPVNINTDRVSLVGLGPGDRRAAAATADDTAIGTRIRAVTGFVGDYIVDVRQPAAGRALNGVTLADFVIDGDDVLEDVSSDLIGGCYFSARAAQMFNVHIRNASGVGLLVEAPASGSYYNSSYVDLNIGECGSHGMVFGANAPDGHVRGLVTHTNGGHGLVFQAAAQHIVDFHSYNNTLSGIYFDNAGSFSTLSGGGVRDNEQHGIHFDAQTAGISDVLLTNIVVGTNGEATNDTYDNIRLQPGGGNSINRVMAHNISFIAGTSNKPKYNLNVTGANARDCIFSNLRFAATSFATASFNDSGARNLINGWGVNAGIPGSAGDWASTAWEGAMVRDTVTGLLYVYQGGAWRNM